MVIIKITIEKELLKSLYYGNQYSSNEIARLFNCTGGGVRYRLKLYDIQIRTDHVYIEPELLLSLYHGNDYNQSELSKIFKCDKKTISLKLDKCGIGKKSHSEVLMGGVGGMKGKHHSKESRRKMSISQLGRISWNKGLTKETDDRILKYSLSNVGREVTLETKKKMSNAKIGTKQTEETILKRTQKLTGLKRSEESKILYSKSKLGSKNPSWKGGLSVIPYSLDFNQELRDRVRERDNYTCQECGYTEEDLGYTLHCHHIDYNKKNSDINNLICLCRSCHQQTNYNRDNWVNYYNNKIDMMQVGIY